MAQVRIEIFRDGEWRERAAGEMEIGAEALAARPIGTPPATTCIEHAYGTATRLSFRIEVF